MIECEECEDAPATTTRINEDDVEINLCDDCADDFDEMESEYEDDDPYA